MGCIHWMRMLARARAQVALLLLIAVVPLGCNTADEQASTQVTKTVGNVECGYAFDWARSDLRSVKRVIVPDTAEVRHDSTGTEMAVYLQKTLDYSGNSSESLSIRDLRHRMGLAGRMEQDALLLATYGEWDADGKGSATITVVVSVPPEVEVVRRPGLAGRSSTANGECFMIHSGPPKPSDDVTAKGWMPLDEKYDPQRRVLQ